MDFNNTKAIYLQIIDFVYEKILQNEWSEGNKIVSVRELAAEFQVNPNTIMRSYEKLQQDGIIFNKRGIGFFVSENAGNVIKKLKKEDFIKNELTSVLYKAKLFGISEKEIIELFLQ